MKKLLLIIPVCMYFQVFAQDNRLVEIPDMTEGNLKNASENSILTVTKNYTFEQKNGTTSLYDNIVSSEITSTYGDYRYAANLKNSLGYVQASYYSYIDANGTIKCSYLFTTTSPYQLAFTDIGGDYVVGTLTSSNNSNLGYVVIVKIAATTGAPVWTKIIGMNVPLTAAWEKIFSPQVIPFSGGTRIACVHQESNSLPDVCLFQINDATGTVTGSNFLSNGLVSNMLYEAKVIPFSTDIAVLTDYATMVVFSSSTGAYNIIQLNSFFKSMAMASNTIYLAGGDGNLVAKLNISSGSSTGYSWVKSYSTFKTYGVSVLTNGNLGVTGGEQDVSGNYKTIFLTLNPANGAVVWTSKSTLLHTYTQVVGGTYGPFAPFLQLTGGAEYAALYTMPNGTASTTDIRLIEIDANGSLNSCYAVPVTATATTVSKTAANQNPTTYSMSLYSVNLPTAVTNVSATLDKTTLCTGTTSLSEAALRENEMLISPNPSRGNLFISFSSLVKEGELIILNSYGSIVLNQKISRASEIALNLKNFVNGVYFVRLIEGEKRYSRKIIIE